MPPLIRWPLIAALIWWVALALGLRISRWLRLPRADLSPWERGFIATTLGFGLLQFLPYTLAAAGQLSTTSIRIAWGVLMLLLVRDLRDAAVGLWRARARFSLRALSGPQRVWALLFASVLAAMVLHALNLGSFGEDDGYHLAAPKRWLQSGTLHYLPTFTTTNVPMGFEMLYAIGLSAGNPLGIKLLHFGAGLMAFLGLWLSARRLGNGLAAVTAISFLLIANPFVNTPYLFRMAYVDLGAAWMAMATVLMWLIWREHLSRQALICLAIFAGFAVTIKLTAAVVAAVWAPIIIWEVRRQGVPWRKIATSAVGLGLIVAAPVVPWLVRNWRNTGNPIFPLLSSLIPTRDWSAQVARDFGLHSKLFSWALVAGARLSVVQRGRILLGVMLLILAIGGVLFARLRRPAWRGLIAFATLSIVAAINIGGLVFRYWLPAMMCVSLVAASWAAVRWPSPRRHFWAASAMLVVALVMIVRNYRLTMRDDLRLATGLATLDDINPTDEGWQMWRYINANTPPDSRIMTAAFYSTYGAGNFGNFWTDRTCFITDAHSQGHIKLGNWKVFRDGVDADGITHVVISSIAYPPDRYGYAFPEALNEYPFNRRLVDQEGEKLVSFGNLELYRLRRAKPASAGSN